MRLFRFQARRSLWMWRWHLISDNELNPLSFRKGASQLGAFPEISALVDHFKGTMAQIAVLEM